MKTNVHIVMTIGLVTLDEAGFYALPVRSGSAFCVTKDLNTWGNVKMLFFHRK